MVARMSFRELRSVASPLSMNTLENMDTLDAGGSLYYSPGIHTATRPYSAGGFGQTPITAEAPRHSPQCCTVPPQPPVPACRARRASRIAVMLGLEPEAVDFAEEPKVLPFVPTERPHVPAAAPRLPAQPQRHLATTSPSPVDYSTRCPTSSFPPAGDTSAAPAAAAIPPFSCVPLAGCPDTAFALVSATSLPPPGAQGVTLQPVIFRRSSCVVYTPGDNGEAPAAPAPVEDALFDRMELEDCPLAPGCPSVSGEALLLVDGRLLAEMSAAAQGGSLGDELTLEAMAHGSMEGPALFCCAVTGANEAAAVEALCPEPGVFEGWEEVSRLPRR